MTTKTDYIPGVCNIGPAEIKKRQQAGWLGVASTIVLWGALYVLQAPAAWRLLLFFPAMLGAMGFLQAALHFCAGFGMLGVFNFGHEAGKTETIEQAEFKRKDRQKAIQIGVYATLIGIATALVGFFVALI